jgi:hypothetical protein
MPRKPVPTIPDKPSGRTKPERPRVNAKLRPDPGPEQFDFWGAFAASWEHEQAGDAAQPSKTNARQRRGGATTSHVAESKDPAKNFVNMSRN